jgi:hypothetical protein
VNIWKKRFLPLLIATTVVNLILFPLFLGGGELSIQAIQTFYRSEIGRGSLVIEAISFLFFVGVTFFFARKERIHREIDRLRANFSKSNTERI